MADIRTIDDLDFNGKTVLVRVDFNTPIKDGRVADDTRIKAALPTIEKLRKDGAKVVLMSHLGRPKGEGFEQDYSLLPVAKRLSEILDDDVLFAEDTVGADAKAKASALENGQVLLLENLRFDPREKKNDEQFAQELSSLADVYVNDAFGTAHRAHASTQGVTSYLDSYAGYLMQREVDTLTGMLEDPKRPFVAILGGSKVSDKIKVIDALLDKCDTLIIGGAMCFTFLAAQGVEVGRSLKEDDWIEKSTEMLEKAKAKGVKLLLPVDVVAAEEISDTAASVSVDINDIPANMMGLDIGPKTAAEYAKAISEGNTVFWNGPMGVFELPPFAKGTQAVAEAVAQNDHADTVIGGGDSVAAVNKFGLADKMTFISTGGGASMELVQGEALPGVEALKN